MKHPVILILGPARTAMSGVTTHLNLLLDSPLARGFDLVHFQVGSEGRRETAAGRLLRWLASPLALAAAIVRHRPRIVHINTSLNARAYWRDLGHLVVARALGCRVIWQVHGGALPLAFVRGVPPAAALLRMTLRWPEVLVVLASVEVDAYRAFVPDRTVIAIPNGIDPGPPTAPASSRPAGPLRLCYVGRLADGKGLFEALDALAASLSRGLDARLEIAGSGPLEAALRARVAALNLDRRVVFAGPVFGADKLALFARSDAFVLPSYSEGLPYALLEAMAAGLPAIATPVGAIPDVMTDGVHGRLVPVRDAEAIAAAIESLGDRAALARMGHASRRRVLEGYSIDRLVERFHELYARLATGRPIGFERWPGTQPESPIDSGSPECAE